MENVTDAAVATCVTVFDADPFEQKTRDVTVLPSLPQEIWVDIFLELPLSEVFRSCRRVSISWHRIVLSDAYCEQAARKFLPEAWNDLVQTQRAQVRPRKPADLTVLPTGMRKQWRLYTDIRPMLFGAVAHVCQECSRYFSKTLLRMRQVDHRLLCTECRRLPQHRIISRATLRQQHSFSSLEFEELTPLYVKGSNNQQHWEDDNYVYFYWQQVENYLEQRRPAKRVCSDQRRTRITHHG